MLYSPHGRVVKSDLDKAPVSQASALPVKTVTATASINAQALADAYQMPYKLLPNSAVRKVIARRLLESKQTAARRVGPQVQPGSRRSEGMRVRHDGAPAELAVVPQVLRGAHRRPRQPRGQA